MPTPPLTCVLIVTWRGAAHITDCLDALAAQDRPHRTIVVDNASDDGTAELIAAHRSEPEVIRVPENLGYAGGISAGLAHVDTPFVAWLNDDAAPHEGWLAELEGALLADSSVAAAGARLMYPDGSLQSTGVRLTADGHGADLNDAAASAAPYEVFGFCGGAALVRTEALRAVGGVPAEFFCYYEDTDTSWRLRLAGWRVLSVPAAGVRHAHGASSRPGSAEFHLWNERNRLLMLLRCAPAAIAVRELARFIAITVLLPIRGVRSSGAAGRAPNLQLRLRLRALAGVLALLPGTLRARRAVRTTLGRGEVWRRWAAG
ncbi:MAG: glycosyltransferase family 2 protein [Thermocrispum sp.]